MGVVDAYFSGYVEAGSGLLSNPGAIWNTASNSFTGSVRGLAVDNNGVVVAGSTDHQIERSTDGGKTFSSNISNNLTGAIFDIEWGNGVFIAVDQYGQIIRSTDAGVTWGALVSNAFATASDEITGLAYDSVGKTWVAVGQDATSVLRSTDDGATWVAPTSGVSVYLDSVVCTGEDTFVALGRAANDVYISTDGGDTWGAAIQVGPDGRYGRSLAYTDGVLLAALMYPFGSPTEYYLYRSVDNGATWSNVDWTVGDAIPGHICGANGWFFVADQISVDGGMTFTSGYSGQSISTPDNAESAIWNPNYNLFVFGGAAAVYYSEWLEAGAGIVESGYDSNGYYRKFSDGTMIQWGSVTHSELTISNNNIGTYGLSIYTNTETVTFPETFTATPYAYSGGITSNVTCLSATVYNVSTSGCTAYVTDNTNSTPTQAWFAIGLWK